MKIDDYIRQREMDESYHRADYATKLRKRASGIVKDRPYTAVRLVLIAKKIEDRQPLSPSDREFLENN